MAETETKTSTARMIFLGEAALSQGFRLIGFEVFPDPTREDLDRIFGQLIDSQERVFVIIDRKSAQTHCPALERIRAEGGRILVTTVPPLNDPTHFHCVIDGQIQSLLGNSLAVKKQA